MEAKNKDLEQQIDLVLVAKQNLEKILIKERRETQNLKQQLESGPTES